VRVPTTGSLVRTGGEVDASVPGATVAGVLTARAERYPAREATTRTATARPTSTAPGT
jgi:hypothetical protein